MTIQQGWTQRQFQGTEWILHAIPLVIGWVTAIAALLLAFHYPIGGACWIGPWPHDCNRDNTCEHGNNAKLYRWVLVHGIFWVVFAFVLVAMGIDLLEGQHRRTSFGALSVLHLVAQPKWKRSMKRMKKLKLYRHPR
jgi:hypothetical protein